MDDVIASPGCEKDRAMWQKASPSKGWLFVWGKEEVFAPEARELVRLTRGLEGEEEMEVEVMEEEGQVHAWPVVALFLGHEREERLKGLKGIVETMVRRMDS